MLGGYPDLDLFPLLFLFSFTSRSTFTSNLISNSLAGAFNLLAGWTFVGDNPVYPLQCSLIPNLKLFNTCIYIYTPSNTLKVWTYSLHRFGFVFLVQTPTYPTVCLSHPLCAHSQFHKTKEGTGQVGGKGNDNGQIFFPLKFEFWNFTPTQKRLEGQGTEEGGLFVDPLTLLLNRQTDIFWMKWYRKIAQDVALKIIL